MRPIDRRLRRGVLVSAAIATAVTIAPRATRAQLPVPVLIEGLTDAEFWSTTAHSNLLTRNGGKWEGIARAQLWQWLHTGGVTFDDGKTPIDFPLFDATLATIRQRLAAATMPGHSRVDEAAEMLGAMTHAETLADFLTLAAYERID